MVLVRVTRWEVVQVWSIVFTAFTVALYIQAYVSSRFDPAQILLWNPLMLVIDAGSMAQVFFLVLEAKQNIVGQRIVLSDSEGPESSTLRFRFLAWWRKDTTACTSSQEHGSTAESVELQEHEYTQSSRRKDATLQSREAVVSTTALERPTSNSRSTQTPSSNPTISKKIPWYRDPAIFSASAAVILFSAVLTLQLIGLAQAAKGYSAHRSPPLVSWCSPLFQPFGLAAVDSNCNVFPVAQSGTRGIGCIQIPGIWQQQWLTGTVVVTSIELIFEVIDVMVLALVSTTAKVRGAKLKRPWATIFSGLAVLGVMLIFGIVYATTIPPQVGTRLTVAMNVDGKIVSYGGTLTTAGLRGSLIGWNDGLFESWQRAYFGDPNY